MITDELGQQLHDKATRGVTLTPPEQVQLAEWYRQQDDAEGHVLGGENGEGAAAALRRDVEQALARMTGVSQEIEALARANEAIRRETAALRERVAQLPMPQPA